ncbi:MAG: type I 3-dehydroquinate dehydratase [Roseburia sp.]|nr:type I 3-dehydroquinate dehydratase [Roseburia sp.]
MTIKGKKIGEGRPCVCVPVMGREKNEIIEEILELVKSPVDIIEWRVDAFSKYLDFNEVREILHTIAPHLTEKIFLYTFRTKLQGGFGDVTSEQLDDIHDIAAESGVVDLLDLEFFAEEYPVIKILRLQEKGIKIVASHHDFEETPERDVMKMLLENMCTGNADIVKIAVMPQSEEDVLRLLAVTSEFYKENPDTPIISMSMGKYGMISRLCGETFGSCVTFAANKESSAPGQMSMGKVIEIIDFLHENITE